MPEQSFVGLGEGWIAARTSASTVPGWTRMNLAIENARAASVAGVCRRCPAIFSSSSGCPLAASAVPVFIAWERRDKSNPKGQSIVTSRSVPQQTAHIFSP